ncbi:MAG: hypothetical protein C4523_07780 [Myxococcales bacterium]|nr:MAG: hypothetical protein C4523_07780 [Myxococcales bacterium]
MKTKLAWMALWAAAALLIGGCMEQTEEECLDECGVGCPSPEYWLCGEDGKWYCNDCEMECYGVVEAGDSSGCPECEEGDQRPADDGCNACTCENGQWACTLIGCEDPAACAADCPDGCPAPEYRFCGEDGELYCNECVMACYGVAEADDPSTCGSECEEGDQRPADDGCNTCDCINGEWACTAMACSDPIEECLMECGDGCFNLNQMACMEDGKMWCPCEAECYGVAAADDPASCQVSPGDPCVAGQVAWAEDGCNSCECMEDDFWSCTEMACPPEPTAEIGEMSECKGQVRLASEEPTDQTLQAEYDAATGAVRVTHTNVMLNCCLAGVAPKLTFDGQTIEIAYEEDYGDEGPCHCICPYDLTLTIDGLASGEWTIVYWADGEAITATATVP